MKITTTKLKQLIREALEEGHRFFPGELDREINHWLNSLVSQNGPLAGLDLKQVIQDYPILKKAAAIAAMVEKSGKSIDPRDLARYEKQFEKIKQKAAMTHDPDYHEDSKELVGRAAAKGFSKFEKAGMQGFPKKKSNT